MSRDVERGKKKKCSVKYVDAKRRNIVHIRRVKYFGNPNRNGRKKRPFKGNVLGII